MALYLAVALILGLLLAAFALFIGYQLVYRLTELHGPVFVPSADDKLKSMLKLAKAKKGEKIVDLGSGDGKIILELAKQGFAAEGIEINPFLVRRAKIRATEQGVSHLATFTRKSFWDVNFADYDLLLMYGTSYIMKKLEKKLLSEMKPGSRMVSTRFRFPNWRPEKEENDVLLYVKK